MYTTCYFNNLFCVLTQVAQPIDRRLLPSHNLVLTTIVTMGCAMLNLSSLVLGIPALLCAILVSKISY